FLINSSAHPRTYETGEDTTRRQIPHQQLRPPQDLRDWRRYHPKADSSSTAPPTPGLTRLAKIPPEGRFLINSSAHPRTYETGEDTTRRQIPHQQLRPPQDLRDWRRYHPKADSSST